MTTKAELRRQLATAHENLEGAWDIILQGHKSEETRNLTLLNQRSELDVAWARVRELQTALDETTEEINTRTVPTEIYDMVLDDLHAAKDRSEALQTDLDDLERAASARQAYRHPDPYLEAQEAAEKAMRKLRKFCENLTTIIPPPPSSLNWPTHSGFTKIVDLKLVIKRDLYGNISVETLP